MRLVIKNGRIIDPAHDRDEIADLYIGDGKIVALGKSPKGFTSARLIDATNRIVCPGAVDLADRKSVV